jgi:hypothetical protein
MRISRRVEEAPSATAAGKKPQYTTEHGALTGVGKSGVREAGGSPQRSESEKRLETGRESDEAVGAVAQHATVPSASETERRWVRLFSMQLYPVRVR